MIYLGADHNGYWLKEELKTYLKKQRVSFKDMGALLLHKEDDYPDYAAKVATHMRSTDMGILICGTGHGMAISANKFKGIRAANAASIFSARKARQDDHANVLALSGWELSAERAKRIVATFIASKPLTAQRYLRRLKKINKLEK
jgi:ribose 5-phosphate isomerase B